MLDRLIDGPKHIVSADLNVAQNALLELKLACLRVLTHEQVGTTPPHARVASLSSRPDAGRACSPLHPRPTSSPVCPPR